MSRDCCVALPRVKVSCAHAKLCKLCVHSSFAIILTGNKELVGLLNLSSWCLVIVVWLFLAVPHVCLQFVIVVFPDYTHLQFLQCLKQKSLKQVKCIE